MSLNYSTDKNIFNSNFELSDSESDVELDFGKSDIDLLDSLQLQYFPEPYNSVGQFLLSAIVGACTSYLARTKDNLIKSQNELYTYLDTYTDYCKNVSNDEYINQLYLSMKLDPNTESDKIKINKILDNTKSYANQLLSELVNKISNTHTFNKTTSDEINMQELNQELTNNLIPMIKFSEIIKLMD